MIGKLVRDRIPEIMQKAGLVANTRRLAANERLHWLLLKLEEETAELVQEPSIEECADVLEVIKAIGVQLGFTEEDLVGVAKAKAQARGAFERGILLQDSGGDDGRD